VDEILAPSEMTYPSLPSRMEERDGFSTLRINGFGLIRFVLVTTATTQSQIINLRLAALHFRNDVIYGEPFSGDAVQTAAILASLSGALVNSLPLSVGDMWLMHRLEL